MVYNSDTTYTSYNAEPATPIIKFPKKFITSSRYGSTYIFVPAEISNSDPSSQTLTYSIINSKPVVASTTPVATLKYKPGVINPSVVINSVGTFQIQASCLASENGYYLGNNTPSLIITISKEIPNIVFNTSSFKSSYTCQPTKPYSLTTPIASITNNKAQLLTYSIVETDGDTPSNIASISSDGTSLTTNSVGSFQIFATPIFATPTAVANGDYGKQGKASETIKIESATPTVITFPTLPSTFTYGNTYPIPYTTTPPYPIVTSNTDTAPGPLITYSSSNATISGSVTCLPNTAIYSINGTTITPVGVGSFQIIVTIGATANYNQATYVYPSQSTYYTSKQATPTISPFPSNYGSTWVINGKYNLTSTVTTNAGSGYTDPNQVTYSIINPSVSNIATISTSGSQITINDAGTFQIQASLAATPNFLAAASIQSNTITIFTVNVSILSNNFSNFVYGGGPYTLSVTTNNTDTNPAPTITYSISPQSGSTGNGTISGNSLTITAAGGAYIYVTITATENFNAANIPIYVNIAQATQVFSLNTTWLNGMSTNLQVGSSFYAGGVILSNSSNNTDPGGPTYTFYTSNSPVTMNGSTINCIGPGSFSYLITAAATANFSAVTLYTSIMYVCVVPEIIIFNNSQLWPPSPSILGEVGLIIGFPGHNYPTTYPYGFMDYTEVTITNKSNNASITINNTSTPYTFNNMCKYGQYLVFFDPNSIGVLSEVLNNPDINIYVAGNMGNVAISSIATGMQIGQPLLFTFGGQISGVGPSTLSIIWNPGSISVLPGQIYGSYYSIAPGVAPFNFNIPSGMTVANGYYIVGWAGYNWGAPLIQLIQAWGVPTNDTNYISFSPLMTNGSFYSPAPLTLNSGESIVFYMGIPKIYNNIGFWFFLPPGSNGTIYNN